MLRSMNLNIPNAFRRGLLIGGAIFTLAISSGCAALFVGGVAAGAGAGAVYYTRGELSSVQSAALDRTFQATHDAMQDLKFTETSSRVDAVEGVVEARTAMDRKIKVVLKRVSDTGTEVRIRVDTFGDEAISRQIMDRIHAKL